MGSAVHLKTELDQIYGNFKANSSPQSIDSINTQASRTLNKKRYLRDLENSEAMLLFFNKEKLDTMKTIKNFKHDIQQAYAHPEKFGVASTNTPRTQFYVGTFLLFTVTVYLAVYYISTFYSAFYKNFSTNSLIHAMFDVRAFGYVPHAGSLQTAIVVGTLLLLFCMARTLSVMQRRKTIFTKLSLYTLFAFTLLLNALLAYHIVKKIAALDVSIASGMFDISTAICKPELWVIIGSGFAGFMIWGLVFDITSKEHGHLGKIKQYVASKLQDVSQLEASAAEINQEIDILRNKITTIKLRLSNLEDPTPGDNERDEYISYYTNFKNGWLKAITADQLSIPYNRQTELLNQCEIAASEHLRQFNFL